MKLAVHQPEFMPWMGFFNKMARADLYVVFDHVQFKKRYFENRNRVVSPQGEVSYLGVPVKTKGRFTQAINQVEIDDTQDWKRPLLKTAALYYGKAPHFRRYFDELHSLVQEAEYTELLALNMALIGFFCRHLGIATPMVFSSAMDVSSFKASDLILQICLQNGADVYLCGASGRDYLQQEDFTRHGIRIEWLDYRCPPYKQLCSSFVANLSTLDLLFNEGPESLRIIMGSGACTERGQ